MFLPGESRLLVVNLGIATPAASATAAAGAAISAASLRPHPLPGEPLLHAASATATAAATVGKSDPGGVCKS